MLARDASAANVGDPPRNLSAYPVIGQATLNWDAPTSGTPTGYRIQQRVSWGEWTNLVGWSKNRPEFQRMLADARSGRFDTIVCWKSDRLSRGMYPAAALMEVVEAYQIEIEPSWTPST